MSAKKQLFRREPSIIYLSDHEDNNKNDDSMDLEFFTPSKDNHQTQTLTRTTRTVHRPDVIYMRSTRRHEQSPQLNIDVANYIPRTIQSYNERRLSILPTFPSVNYNNQIHLLLANVTPHQLSPEQLARRQSGKYSCPFTITNADLSTTSFMLKYYYKMFGSILERFKIDLSILDHNYARLQNFIELFRASRAKILSSGNRSSEDFGELNENELPLLLEFYLQMDVDLFYMKTCSFRDAQPRSSNEGIFSIAAPECHYRMSKCGTCKLCSLPTDQIQPVMFNRYERHRFVNTYESILNCPVDCRTKNYIYVLTCVCGEFEYISEANFPLGERLNNHCHTANHVIRKVLLGKNNVYQYQAQQQQQQQQQQTGMQSSHKENMLLFQHSSMCSAAIQMFLDKNTAYWPFVPMPIDEAQHDNVHFRTSSMAPRKTTTDTFNINDQDASIIQFLNQVPKPPPGFKFSKRQLQQQVSCFQQNLLAEPFNDEVYVYRATILAVMPPNTSDLFRRMIHSLFVTHTEAKLNTLGHLFSTMNSITIRNGIWCHNLVRRPTFT